MSTAALDGLPSSCWCLAATQPSIEAEPPEPTMKTTHHEGREVSAWLCRALTSRRLTLTKTAAVLLVAGATGWPAGSSAQTTQATELPLTVLEKSFWVCDYAATTGGIDSGTAIACGSLTEALKQRKFAGDFAAMLAWWQQHKEAEYRVLASMGGPSLARLAPPALK